jgi:2-methylcitrate dehydratase PrpD
MKAAIDIVVANNLALTDIARIRLHVGDYHDLMCRPLDERRAPATLADAKFSLPFLVAVAIVRRGMSITDFSASGLRDPDVLATGGKITLISDPALDWKMELPLGRVEIVARDGRSWIQDGRGVPGNADNPMTWDDIGAKFTECASVSINSIPGEGIARALDLACMLEDVPDATELVRALALQL